MVELQPFPIPLTSFRVWDAFTTNLPAAGANDDLGLVGGTFSSATPSLRSLDAKAIGSATSSYARALIQLPWEYVAGNTVTLRFKAGMIGAVSDPTATLDCQAYKLQADPDDAIGSDLVSTGATTINSLTFADIDFVIAAGSLSPGDILDLRIQTAINDAAGANPVYAGITSCKLLADVR
jgi:hypothetical protein